MPYKIKDWDSIFENCGSRKLKTLTWVPVPNKWDGLGFARLRKHKRCAEILGGWLIILQIASKCEPRGTLCRDGLPMSREDMADVTGVPESAFSLALDVLSNPAEGICWIIKEPDTENEARVAQSPDTSGNAPDVTGKSPAVLNGMEQNRIEQKIRNGVSLLFHRKDSTKWTNKENAQLAIISKRPDAESEFEEIRKLYDSGYKYRRQEVITFLNNWAGELDKARNYKPEDNTRFAIGQIHHQEGELPQWKK